MNWLNSRMKNISCSDNWKKFYMKMTLEEDSSKKQSMKLQIWIVLVNLSSWFGIFTSVLSDPVQPAGGYMGDPNTVVHAHLYLPLPTRNPLFKVSAATPPHNLLQSVSMIDNMFFKYKRISKTILEKSRSNFT